MDDHSGEDIAFFSHTPTPGISAKDTMSKVKERSVVDCQESYVRGNQDLKAN